MEMIVLGESLSNVQNDNFGEIAKNSLFFLIFQVSIKYCNFSVVYHPNRLLFNVMDVVRKTIFTVLTQNFQQIFFFLVFRLFKNHENPDFGTQIVPTTSKLNSPVLPIILVQLRCNSLT